MKKLILPLITVLILLSACGTEVPEPERCSLCDDLSRHAPCIINLSTGEKLELDVYHCRNLLADYKNQGYALVDLKDSKCPVIYAINDGMKATFRCYKISVQEIKEDRKYEITIIGTL